uniref:Major facilitator superfamily (MFS) profile domain-containing protein n=1 Tax=Candidatus Kentrum sp. FW TaxID=2126338 RepID=A0A450TXQ8_9GAMM|nr:MAG: hypothetical protein BECKFW1821C_GA0114237_105918 [Candidatus Kentron sp. FW]
MAHPPLDLEVTKRKTFLNDRPLTLMLLAFGFCAGGVESGIRDWIFIFGIKMAVPEQQAYWLISLFFAGLTAGRALAIFLNRLLDPKKLMTIILVLMLLELPFLYLVPQVIPAVTFFLGLLMGPTVPGILGIFANDLKLNGELTGSFFLGLGLGGMTPYFVGAALDRAGSWILPFMIGLYVLGMGLAWVFVRQRIHQVRWHHQDNSGRFLPRV